MAVAVNARQVEVKTTIKKMVCLLEKWEKVGDEDEEEQAPPREYPGTYPNNGQGSESLVGKLDGAPG